ncbi:endonuclease domain-containing protein [Aliikangiella sp. IMCC44653]
MKENNTIFNKKKYKALRTLLRKQQTFQENILWGKIRGRQLGFKFRRQHGIGNYIVDFYCPENKLVIEIDGDSHFNHESVKKDHKRDTYLKSIGITVLRFTNLDITENIDSVLEKIKQSLDPL